MNLKAHQVCF